MSSPRVKSNSAKQVCVAAAALFVWNGVVVPSLYAEGHTDVGVKMGGSSTTVAYYESKSKDGKTRLEKASVTVGGIPLGVCIFRDIDDHFSVMGNFSITALLRSRQVLRQGFDGGVAWHILGGPKQLTTTSGFMTQTVSYPFNMSLYGNGGIFNYRISDAVSDDNNENVASVSGGVFEFSLGLEFRRDISERHGVGIDLESTVYSLPTTDERITPSTRAVLLFWRMLI